MHRRASLALIVTLLSALTLASSAQAAFRTTVTPSPALADFELKRVAMVLAECHEVVDCSRVEAGAVAAAAELKLPFEVVSEAAIRELLMSKGEPRYTPEHRELLLEHFELSAVFELSLPFAARGDGFGGSRRSEVKVEMRLLAPDGSMLLHGVGTGRPKNVVSGPERVASRVIRELLRAAFP